MKKRFQLTRFITLLFYVVALFVIQGFKNTQINASFPSPLEKTIFAFYYDFSTTGIYNNNQISSDTIKILKDKIQKFNPQISAEKTGDFLSSLFSQANFKPEQLYLYLAQDKSFVFTILGKFPWKRWKEIYPQNTVVNRVDGFSISVPANFVQGKRLSMNVSSNMLLICPEDISGNVMNKISSDINRQHISFPVFQKMVLQKPVIAFETNIEELINSAKSSHIGIEMPSLIDKISHLRFIAHRKISKLQLSVNNDDERIKTSNELTESLNQYVSDVSTITTNIKNTSIYFSAKPSDTIANKISYDIGGLLLHFMTKINHQNSMVLSKKEKGPNIHDNNTFSDEQKTNKKLGKSNNN